MAGDWLKWTKGLPRKVEVMQMATKLGVLPVHVAATYMVFGEWLDDNVSAKDIDANGTAHISLDGIQPDFVDRIVELPGFIAAMASVGWVHISENWLSIPDFTQHNPQTAKMRAYGMERLEAEEPTEAKPPRQERGARKPAPQKARRAKAAKRRSKRSKAQRATP